MVRTMLLIAVVAAVAEAVPAPKAVGLRGSAPSPDLPLSDPRLHAVSTVEQVHITAGSTPSSVFVTWVTNVSEATTVRYKAAGADQAWSSLSGPPGQVYSSLMDPRFPASEGGCIGSKNYTNPYCFYTSGEIHTVELTGLKPATSYTYSVGSATSKQFSFKTPPAVGRKEALKLLVVGDLGQTENSSSTMDNMQKLLNAGHVDMVLFAGDLSYSDGNGHRWDSYGRLGEKLWAAVPTAHTGGNHEISNGGENWVGYTYRYPNPHTATGSDSPLWYSLEVGPAHITVLCSYHPSSAHQQENQFLSLGLKHIRSSNLEISAITMGFTYVSTIARIIAWSQTRCVFGGSRYADFTEGSIQAHWLKQDLASVDRAKTPWLIALWHTPWCAPPVPRHTEPLTAIYEINK